MDNLPNPNCRFCCDDSEVAEQIIEDEIQSRMEEITKKRYTVLGIRADETCHLMTNVADKALAHAHAMSEAKTHSYASNRPSSFKWGCVLVLCDNQVEARYPL